MTNEPHILVIDDEPQIVRALKTILTQNGYRVSTASRGEEGLDIAAMTPPSVVILDLRLPDISGLEVTRRLREWTQVPILILSVREGEQDKVAVLDAGADDYLTKPFGIEELLARVRVALRHATQAQGSPEPIVQVGDLIIDLARHIVTRGGEEVRLTPTEYDLLAYLAINAGRVLTHSTILEHVWGSSESNNVEYLRVYMMQLRKKLEDDPRHPRVLITEPGIGYRFLTGD
jgi:two-component system, OmpR family, KDP operon response regulator KdpE